MRKGWHRMVDATKQGIEEIWCAGIALLYSWKAKSYLERGERIGLDLIQHKTKTGAKWLLFSFDHLAILNLQKQVDLFLQDISFLIP